MVLMALRGVYNSPFNLDDPVAGDWRRMNLYHVIQQTNCHLAMPESPMKFLNGSERTQRELRRAIAKMYNFKLLTYNLIHVLINN